MRTPTHTGCERDKEHSQHGQSAQGGPYIRAWPQNMPHQGSQTNLWLLQEAKILTAEARKEQEVNINLGRGRESPWERDRAWKLSLWQFYGFWGGGSRKNRSLISPWL